MKKIFGVIIVFAIIFSLSSCGIHTGLTNNANNHTTTVVLEKKNYRIVQKVKGTSSGLYVLMFGGSFSAEIEAARSRMLESAGLIGSSRAVINETVETNWKIFFFVNIVTITVSAYVIEFTE